MLDVLENTDNRHLTQSTANAFDYVQCLMPVHTCWQ